MVFFRLFRVSFVVCLVLEGQTSAFAIKRGHQQRDTIRWTTPTTRTMKNQHAVVSSRRKMPTTVSGRIMLYTISTTTQLRSGSQDDAFSDLTSSLARLDNQWKIQEATRKGKSRWSKLFLPGDTDDDRPPQEVGIGEDMTGQTMTMMDQSSNDYVWVLDPPANTIPSCVIVFTGGAGLGQFPHIAYNELLTRISDKLNALCIAAPYSVGLDHFQLAKSSGERIRRALVYLEDDPNRPYPMPTRTYSIAHSLGCKLQTIYMAATGQTFDGIGFMAYNNFGFARTIKMARTFAEELRQSTVRSRGGFDAPRSSTSKAEDVISGLFDFAELAVGAIGVDFSPNAQDTDRLIQLRYDDVLQSKTRVFVFDDDNLDSSREFFEACSGGAVGPSLCGLPGGHLSPVYFQWTMDDLAGFEENNIPLDAREMAKEAMGGLQSASFGDEAALNALVDAVCDWILGKPAKRGPIWARNAEEVVDGPVPRITGGTANSAGSTDN